MIDQRIAIIGGTGKFGKHLGEKLQEDNEIVISGRNLERAREEAEPYDWEFGEAKEIVKDADVVIVSVPIDVTVDVIHKVGPNVPEDALFCDVTSVKEKPVEAMKQYSDEVLGMHPMYAPTNSIKGQKVVLCPEKGERWTVMEEFWEEHGADIHFTEPEAHDKATSIIQGLMHFSELVIADVMMKSKASANDLEEMSTPIYQLITDLTARMLNQKPELYGSIQKENPEIQNVREMFQDSAEELREVIEEDGDFSSKFNELGKQYKLDEAQERTDKLIEFLSGEVRYD